MKTYVIHGSPLSGKSTYVEKNKGENDLIYDFDLIMSAISGLPKHQDNKYLIDYVLSVRDIIISKLKSESNIDNAWIITTRVTEDFKESLIGLNPIYIKMKSDIKTIKGRLKTDPDGRDIKEYTEAIDRYHERKQGLSDFYNKQAWKSKRVAILKRDNYKCRECKRFGRVTGADTIHHALPLEIRPDLKLNNNNLVSLCNECHEAMHNKFDNKLSKLGAWWMDRTIRMYPELVSVR